MVLIQENDPQQKPCSITNVQVYYPEVQPSKILSHMKYCITFDYNENPQQIYRRYSDFKAFRKNLRTFMPYHYIYPLHQSKLISNNDTLMLKDRMEELNHFLNFLITNQDLFECDAYWKFFDSNLDETKIGEILEKMNHNTYQYIDFTFKRKYPELYQKEYAEGMESPLLKFKERIELSVNFCKSFHQSIRNYTLTLEESPISQHFQTFLNLLSIHYSNAVKPEVYQEVEKSYQTVCEVKQVDVWKVLEKKAKMITLEINCLVEIHKDFQKIVQTKRLEEEQLMKLKNEFKKLELSDVQTVGFFKKKTKEDKLEQLKQQIKDSEEKIVLYKRLISISSEIFMNSQLDLIKQQKQKRFKVIIDQFVKDQLKQNEKEKGLWEVILKSNACLFDGQSEKIAIDQQNLQRISLQIYIKLLQFYFKNFYRISITYSKSQITEFIH